MMTSELPDQLSNEWTLWSHLPHEKDWSINGYKVISKFNTVGTTVGVCKSIPPILIQTSMLYLMKNSIKPICLAGNTLSDNEACMATITGITVSPKRKFCIVKIWMSGREFQDPSIITKDIPGLSSQGCLFKKFDPEY